MNRFLLPVFVINVYINSACKSFLPTLEFRSEGLQDFRHGVLHCTARVLYFAKSLTGVNFSPMMGHGRCIFLTLSCDTPAKISECLHHVSYKYW